MIQAIQRTLRELLSAGDAPSRTGPHVELLNDTRHLVFDSEEGPRIYLPIANTFLRVIAFGVDAVIVALLSGLMLRLSALLFSSISSPSTEAYATLVAVNILPVVIYPLFVELAFYGRSLGAILMGLDIVDAHGSSLTWGQIALRRIASAVEPGLAAWLVLALPIVENNWIAKLFLAGAAMVIQALHVYANPARQRLSDAIAGVVVIERAPRYEWLPAIPSKVDQGFKLSPAQLDMYGSYELHVMEQCLHAWALNDKRPLRRAAEAIRAKLRLDIADDYTVVLSVYTLLRADLEQKQRTGNLRLRKRPGAVPRP